MKMTPAVVVIGSLLVFWTCVFLVVALPSLTMDEKPPEGSSWRAWSAAEAAGHDLYVRNGCSYCHSQYVRVSDWDAGAGRVAERWDYYSYNPAILGTERTGPDLSQQAGEHPDDWHVAHFTNPRFTRPMSLMPSWEFLGREDIESLIRYMQSLGGRDGDYRFARQKQWKEPAVHAHKGTPPENIAWLHDHVPPVWRPMPNPYPAEPANLERGKKTFQQFCINCHGPMGDGKGPAEKHLDPPPLDFTTLRGHLVEGKYIGGIFYYQIMNGITGTAMPYFKRELESEKIWDVSNYVAVTFLGYTDAGLEPRGIPAAYEPVWKNTYPPPGTQPDNAPQGVNP